jgi:hypothetical protein
VARPICTQLIHAKHNRDVANVGKTWYRKGNWIEVVGYVTQLTRRRVWLPPSQALENIPVKALSEHLHSECGLGPSSTTAASWFSYSCCCRISSVDSLRRNETVPKKQNIFFKQYTNILSDHTLNNRLL